MNVLLAKKLIENGAIRQSTELEAYYNAHGLSCVDNSNIIGKFTLVAARYAEKETEIIFECLSEDGLKPYRFTNKEVLSLDGMPPDRVASIYNLKDNGEEMTGCGKRRGRKPKGFLGDEFKSDLG
jgi:hypothetical protein